MSWRGGGDDNRDDVEEEEELDEAVSSLSSRVDLLHH
jgi:hypothetical protein